MLILTNDWPRNNWMLITHFQCLPNYISVRTDSWFNKPDHVLLPNIIAYCQQNRYVWLAIYTESFTLKITYKSKDCKLFSYYSCAMCLKQSKNVTRNNKKNLLSSFLPNVNENESRLNKAVRDANQPNYVI